GASVFAYTSLFRSGAAQWFEVGVGVVRAVGLDDVADGVGQPVPGGGAEEGRAAEPAQIEPGAGLPAWSRRCVVPRCRTTRRRGIDGLRIHGHLRLHGPADGAPQGGLGLGRRCASSRPGRCLMLPTPACATGRLRPSVKRITHSSEAGCRDDFAPPPGPAPVIPKPDAAPDTANGTGRHTRLWDIKPPPSS